MKVYTYSQARQKLAEVLDVARKEGQVSIRRRDGQTYILKPMNNYDSPLDVSGVDTDISLDELNNVVRESRERD